MALTLRETLPNGLVVVVEERGTADTVALQLTARAGVRDDGDTPGITTLTSRIMFQGTPRHPTETDLQRAATRVGGTISRGTEPELSHFSSSMPAGEVETGVDLLADVVTNAVLAERALSLQREIALQELARLRSDPNALIQQLFQEALFAGHPIAAWGVGTPESLATLTREGISTHRARMWGAANLVLGVAGRIAAPAAVALASRYFGALPAGELWERGGAPPPTPTPGTVRGVAGQQQAVFRVGFVVPGQGSEDRHALRILNDLMTGSSGRLFEELRNARGLVYTTGSSYFAFTDAGAWYAAAGADPEAVEPALQVIRDEIQRLRSAPPDAAELDLHISQFAGRQILAGEGNGTRAALLVAQETLGADTTEVLVSRAREVTGEDVLRVARDYIDPDRAVTLIVGPAPAA